MVDERLKRESGGHQDVNVGRIDEPSVSVAVADSSTPDLLGVSQDWFPAGSVPADGPSADVINEVVVSSTTNIDDWNVDASGQQGVADADRVAGMPNACNAYRIPVDNSVMDVSESSDIDVDGDGDSNGDDDLDDISDPDFEYVSESEFEYGSDSYEEDDRDVDIEGDGSMVGSDELSEDYNVSNGSSASDHPFFDDSHSGGSHSNEGPSHENGPFSEDYNVSNSEPSFFSETSSIDELSDANDDNVDDSDGDDVVSVISVYGSSNEDDYISDELSMLSEDNDAIGGVYKFHDLTNDGSDDGIDDSIEGSNDGFLNFRGAVEVQLFSDGYWIVIPIPS